jgi:aryl-alcohol dehydrogenase-like predicted oxidoreductase
MPIPGRATSQGTEGFARQFGRLPARHWREGPGWTASSIGIGTYLGHHTADADRSYADAVKAALANGCNVIDTAVNYRSQRSERSIGRALQEAIAAREISRDEVIVCTKGGFLPFDGEPPSDAAAYFQATYLRPGIARPEEIVAGCHCLAPGYLENQISASLRNLGLETVDVYYLHNPETQLEEVAPEEFRRRIEAAFRVLEAAASAGRIGVYGMATWEAFRADRSRKNYVSLASMVDIARSVGGESHKFRVIQLPYNLAMLEGHLTPTQSTPAGETLPAIQAARAMGLTVFTSVPLLQTRLLSAIPEKIYPLFPGLTTNAQRAIQFARSTPGVAAPLVGMSKPDHVLENLRTAKAEPLSDSNFARLFA